MVNVPPELIGELQEFDQDTAHAWNCWVLDPATGRPFRRVVEAYAWRGYLIRTRVDERGQLLRGESGRALTERVNTDLIIWRGPYLPTLTQVLAARRGPRRPSTAQPEART